MADVLAPLPPKILDDATNVVSDDNGSGHDEDDDHSVPTTTTATTTTTTTTTEAWSETEGSNHEDEEEDFVVEDDENGIAIMDSLAMMVENHISSNKGSNDNAEDPNFVTNSDENPSSDNMSHAADAFVAAELAKLSVQDREKVLYDIHGIAEPIPETPEFLQQKLMEFQNALEVSHQAEPALAKGYELALSTNPEHVRNTDFQLQFLRADQFDVQLAAKRFIKHFQVKLNLFGPSKIGKTITQDDLVDYDDTVNALYDGFKQVLPLRDRAGRLCFVDMCKNAKLDNYRSVQAKCRRKFYSSMVVAEDIETQRKGCVCIMYAVDSNNTPKFDWQYARGIMDVLEAVPVRMDCFHFCHNNRWKWGPYIALFQLVTNARNAVRSRTHYVIRKFCSSFKPLAYPSVMSSKIQQKVMAEEVEQQQADLTTEAPKEDTTPVAAPTTSSEILEMNKEPTVVQAEEQEQTAAARTSQPEEKKKSSILFPAQFDVLLGRGRGYHGHVGNIRFRNLVLQEYAERYAQAKSRNAKKQLTLEVLQRIHDIPAKFLRQDVTGWVEAEEEEARLKVSHTFRNLKAAANGTSAAATRRNNKSKKALEVVEETKEQQQQQDDDNTSSNDEATAATNSKRIRSETFGREFYSLE